MSRAAASIRAIGADRLRGGLGLERRESCLELVVVALAIRSVVHAPMARRADGDHVVVVVRPPVREASRVVRLEVEMPACRHKWRRLTAPLAQTVSTPPHIHAQVVASGVGPTLCLARVGHMPDRLRSSIAELVGHSDLVTTARTYTHVVADEAELDYARLIA